jgi:hypothetical protein
VGCTFKPQITEYKSPHLTSIKDAPLKSEKSLVFDNLYLKAKAKPKPLPKDPKDIEFEKQKQECTFKPDISRTKHVLFGSKSSAIGELKSG